MTRDEAFNLVARIESMWGGRWSTNRTETWASALEQLSEQGTSDAIRRLGNTEKDCPSLAVLRVESGHHEARRVVACSLCDATGWQVYTADEHGYHEVDRCAHRKPCKPFDGCTCEDGPFPRCTCSMAKPCKCTNAQQANNLMAKFANDNKWPQRSSAA